MVLPATAPPRLRTVALRVKVAPVNGLLGLAVGWSTSRSGGPTTVTLTPVEQLFVVLDSFVTVLTQAP